MESYAQNGTECHLLLKIAIGSFPIRTSEFPKPVPEASRDSKIRVREHFEQQVGLPWPIWAAIGTLEGSILALWGLIFGSPGIHCGARERCWCHSWGFHLRFPARHMVTLSDLAAIFAENTKIIQKPMFSNGFSLILRLPRSHNYDFWGPGGDFWHV